MKAGRVFGDTPAPDDADRLAMDKRRANDAADASMLRDRVIAAFGEQYLVESEIGRGGMAVVYAASDVRLQRAVALKVLPPDMAFRSEIRERFVREAQTAARLNHPHIVPIYAVHEQAGLVCFAMSLVHGESLAARIAREPRASFEFVAEVLEQVADALAYAHANGIVHRDIKPDNILLDRVSGRAMVTDFGIARAAESGARLTQAGIAVGTPAFMSPEQATGEREVDGRSDVYSLGVVGYLLLAGRLPFEAATTPAMLVKHVSETPPSIRSVRPEAPPVLVELLEKCLAKRPADRWENALTLRDALRRARRDGSLQQVGRAYQAPLPVSQPTPRGLDQPYRDAREQADKYGHRHQDWSPRLPSVLRRDHREQWKDAQRRGLTVGAYPGDGKDLSAVPLARQIVRFRYRLLSSGALVTFLVFLNANSGGFPWVIFPAFGIGMGVISRLSALREQGASLGQIFGPDSHLYPPAQAVDPRPFGERVVKGVRSLKKRLRFAAGFAIGAIGTFIIGGSLNLQPMVVPFVATLIGTMVSLQLSMISGARLRRLGVPVGSMLDEHWRPAGGVPEHRPRELLLREATDRVAGTAVLSSRYGATVRSAVEDRLAIKDSSSRLTDADRSLVPDVEPTADALLERVGALAAGLERLDRDMPSSMGSQLDARIAATEAEPEHAPDRERRLSLLTRQRASMQELVSRRETMERQLENASMALRTLRFDMVKLHTLGIGAVINDVTSATQEARALSRDIGHALQAAKEVRRL